MSGLGAALSLGAPAFEADRTPGGVCYSSYLDENGSLRDPASESVADCFRFERAGGHWLFGAGAPLLKWFGKYASFRAYERRAAVFFPAQGWLVPYPIQEHLRCFPDPLRTRAVSEILNGLEAPTSAPATFKEWLRTHFGPTLCELFFFPFNDRYTAGLYAETAPQDAYKTPIAKDRVLQGAERAGPSSGYNAAFHYPVAGLDAFVRALAEKARVHCRHEVVRIDTTQRIVHFANGASCEFEALVCSLPLDRTLALSGLSAGTAADPSTAVLVVNIAATVGPACPDVHWLYLSHSASGLHRVGFYSNVDPAFLPERRRKPLDMVSLYAERSYRADQLPTSEQVAQVCRAVVAELQEWGFIGDPIVVHPTLTNPAYTWTQPRSDWVERGCRALRDRGVRQIGRYGLWRFQGMADSFQQGFLTRPESARSQPLIHRTGEST